MEKLSKRVDIIFKIAIIIIAIMFLKQEFKESEVGRYEYVERRIGIGIVIDTKTGDIYYRSPSDSLDFYYKGMSIKIE